MTNGFSLLYGLGIIVIAIFLGSVLKYSIGINIHNYLTYMGIVLGSLGLIGSRISVFDLKHPKKMSF